MTSQSSWLMAHPVGSMSKENSKRPQKFTSKYFSQAKEQHHADRDEWALYIGRIVVIFTEIEDLAINAIGWLAPPFLDFSKALLLEKRLELLSIIIKSHADLSDGAKADFCAAISKVKKSASKRNLIAHNPVKLLFLTDFESTVISAGGVIAHARNENLTMDLAQVIAFLNEASECYLCLFNAQAKANAEKRKAQSLRDRRARRRRGAALRRAQLSSGIEHS